MLSAVIPQPAPMVTVMSQNLSLGTDVTPVIAALVSGNQKLITAAATAARIKVEASAMDGLAAAIAAEIVSADPDVVGLQEAELIRVAGAVTAPR